MVLMWAQRIIGWRCANCTNEWPMERLGPRWKRWSRCPRCRAEAIEAKTEWGWV